MSCTSDASDQAEEAQKGRFFKRTQACLDAGYVCFDSCSEMHLLQHLSHPWSCEKGTN